MHNLIIYFNNLNLSLSISGIFFIICIYHEIVYKYGDINAAYYDLHLSYYMFFYQVFISNFKKKHTNCILS